MQRLCKNLLNASDKSDNFIKSYFSRNNIIKLNLGCGKNYLKTWINTDISDKIKKDIYLDVTKKFPFRDSCIDFVFSEHMFEHLKLNEQINMLKECFRVMKKSTVIRIAQPSLSFIMDLYANPEKEIHKKYMSWAVGEIPALKEVKNKFKDSTSLQTFVINNFFYNWEHKMIHDFNSCKEIMEYCGFSEINLNTTGKSKFMELNAIEMHGKIIPEEFNILETMVVEAIK